MRPLRLVLLIRIKYGTIIILTYSCLEQISNEPLCSSLYQIKVFTYENYINVTRPPTETDDVYYVI